MNSPHPAPPPCKPPRVVLCEVCGDGIKGLLIGVRRSGFAADCCLECGAELGQMCAEGISFSACSREELIKFARIRLVGKRPSWAAAAEALLDERRQLWEAMEAV